MKFSYNMNSTNIILCLIGLGILIFFLGVLAVGEFKPEVQPEVRPITDQNNQEIIEQVVNKIKITGVGINSQYRYLWLNDGTHIQTECPSDLYPFSSNSTHYKCGNEDWKRVIPENQTTNTKLGLSREPDTDMTPEKLESLRLAWNESDIRRMEISRIKPPNYEQMIIYEFESGKLSHVKSCENLHSYYLLYYGQVYAKQYDYSKNKIITDYLKERMKEINCEFKELPELKEKIDLEKERVENATQKVMEELDEVNATSLEDVNVYD